SESLGPNTPAPVLGPTAQTDLTKTLGKEAHTALVPAATPPPAPVQTDLQKQIADAQADLQRWKSVGSETHIKAAMDRLEALTKGIPSIADTLNTAAQTQVPPGAVSIPATPPNLSATLDNAVQ